MQVKHEGVSNEYNGSRDEGRDVSNTEEIVSVVSRSSFRLEVKMS